MSRCGSSHSRAVSSQSFSVINQQLRRSSHLCVCQLPVNVNSRRASVVLRQVTHVCVGEEVTGGDATDCLVDVHGCDLSWSPANPICYTVNVHVCLGHHCLCWIKSQSVQFTMQTAHIKLNTLQAQTVECTDVQPKHILTNKKVHLLGFCMLMLR